jgi:hypothetical protein
VQQRAPRDADRVEAVEDRRLHAAAPGDLRVDVDRMRIHSAVAIEKALHGEGLVGRSMVGRAIGDAGLWASRSRRAAEAPLTPHE